MKHIWLLVASSSPATGVQCRETPEHKGIEDNQFIQNCKSNSKVQREE